MTTIARRGPDVLPSYLLIVTDKSAKFISGSHAALTGGDDWRFYSWPMFYSHFCTRIIIPRTSEVQNDGVLLWHGYHSENFTTL